MIDFLLIFFLYPIAQKRYIYDNRLNNTNDDRDNAYSLDDLFGGFTVNIHVYQKKECADVLILHNLVVS